MEAGWASIADVTVATDGTSGNLAGGAASGVLAQFAPADGHDGHFVVIGGTVYAKFVPQLLRRPLFFEHLEHLALFSAVDTWRRPALLPMGEPLVLRFD